MPYNKSAPRLTNFEITIIRPNDIPWELTGGMISNYFRTAYELLFHPLLVFSSPPKAGVFHILLFSLLSEFYPASISLSFNIIRASLKADSNYWNALFTGGGMDTIIWGYIAILKSYSIVILPQLSLTLVGAIVLYSTVIVIDLCLAIFRSFINSHFFTAFTISAFYMSRPGFDLMFCFRSFCYASFAQIFYHYLSVARPIGYCLFIYIIWASLASNFSGAKIRNLAIASISFATTLEIQHSIFISSIAPIFMK